MRLPTRANLAAAGSLRRFLAKGPGDRGHAPTPAEPAQFDDGSHTHSYAYVSNKPGTSIGIQATFNIWKPVVPIAESFSLSQFWMIGGTGTQMQAVEAGWQVYPAHYGDWLPHFFIYWTADAYRTTGCYNLDCAAFIQTSSVLTPGQGVPTSTTNGPQVEGVVAFYRDPANGNWGLYTQNADGSYTMLGYYPARLFGAGALSKGGMLLEFGGEVAIGDAYLGAYQVPMGSAADPRYAGPPEYGKVAYQRGMKYMGADGIARDFPINGVSTDCGYGLAKGFGASTSYGTQPTWGTWIFFGGGGC
jgi:hypothetical protein